MKALGNVNRTVARRTRRRAAHHWPLRRPSACAFRAGPTESVSKAWAWSLDAVGNWETYQEDNGDGSSGLPDGDYLDAEDLNQTRTHNNANEIYNATPGSAITEGGGQSAWDDPVSDSRGNMTGVPTPSDMTDSYTCVYDAWNRLVEVRDSSEAIVAQYRYDGLSRRIRKYVADGSDWTVTEYYYNAGWQLLETRRAEDVERTGAPLAEPALSSTVQEQYVWSQRYIDAPVLRDRDSDSDGDPEDGDLGKADSGLDERIYYCTDAQMNVTAIVDGTPGSGTIGDVLERYTYDPYGQVEFKTPVWAASTSQYDNAILYCGYHRDDETGLYHVRNRMYHPTLGRWLQRDPLGYVDGMSLYEYSGSGPMAGIDPYGLQTGLAIGAENGAVNRRASLGAAYNSLSASARAGMGQLRNAWGSGTLSVRDGRLMMGRDIIAVPADSVYGGGELRAAIGAVENNCDSRSTTYGGCDPITIDCVARAKAEARRRVDARAAELAREKENAKRAASAKAWADAAEARAWARLRADIAQAKAAAEEGESAAKAAADSAANAAQTSKPPCPENSPDPGKDPKKVPGSSKQFGTKYARHKDPHPPRV